MKKKLALGALLLGLTAVAGVACNQGESNKPVVLLDFAQTATEEAVKVGDLYELRRSVVDEEGNSYSLQYEVKDSDGNRVSVVSNCFEVTDLEGYTITYTVTVAEGDVRTCVVSLPAYDGDGPIVSLGTLPTGEIGKEYTIPKITVSDISAITEQSVKLYLVGDSLTEITLTEADGAYKFTPTEEGTYRLVASAKDAAGNETSRTAEFVVEKILIGEVFNPASANASSQVYFGDNNNTFTGTQKEFISAEDNTDGVYGGAYMRAVAANPSGAWANVMLSPRFGAEAYEGYDKVTVWLYVESAASDKVTTLFFNDTALTQSITPNQWTQVVLDADAFFNKIFGGNTYFFAIKYDETVTGVRVGEILGVNDATLTLSQPTGTILDGESTDVEFTVTADPADTAYTVVVKNDAGEVQPLNSLGAGKYSVTLTSVGNYTVTATAKDGRYGVAEASFTVTLPNRIIVSGSYATSAPIGSAITLNAAQVKRGDSITDETVTVKVYVLEGAEWVDASAQIADGAYTPVAEGKIKIEYTFEDFDPITYEIETFDPSWVFNPGLEGAGSQITYGSNNTVFAGSVKEFISADDNTDGVYGGAYLRAVPTNPSAWGNIILQPKYALDVYGGYEAITAWIYIESATNDAVKVFFYNDTALTQDIVPNQWTRVIIPLENFNKGLLDGGAWQYFCSMQYSKTVTGVRIGEIRAANAVSFTVSKPADVILEGDSAEAEFTVTAGAADVEYTVSVTDAAGAAQEVVALGEGKYKTTASAVGVYTVTVTATGVYYGTTQQTFKVVYPQRIVVSGEYAQKSVINTGITVLSAVVQQGDTPTDDVVTVKVYAQDGEGWLDVTADMVGGIYTPTAEGKLKIEYTYGDLTPIVYEIEVYDPAILFDPASPSAATQITYGTNNNMFAGTQKEFISAEENTDAVYGGAYLRSAPTNTGKWGNVLLTPKLGYDGYSAYDVITLWIYVESSDASASVLFLNDTSLTQVVTANQWTQVVIPVATYQEKANGNYFCSINCNGNNKAIRLGEIKAMTMAEFTVSEVADVVLSGDSAEAEFTVTADAADVEYTVSVTDAAGATQEVVALGEGKYKATVSAAGQYTVTVTATGAYYGTTQKTFNVVHPQRIAVDGEYAEKTPMNQGLALLSAAVLRGETPTEDVVTVKVYAFDGADWVDVSASVKEGVYTPTAEGQIKVEYSFGDLTPVVYEIEVYDSTVVFDPASEGAASQITYGTNNTVFSGSAKQFVSAEENTDAVYGGAYLRAVPTNPSAWGNIMLSMKHEADVYAAYDVISVWCYVEATNNTAVNVFFFNNTALTQSVTPNQWTQVIIPRDSFVSGVSSTYFCSTKYSSVVTGMRIGEIKAMNTVNLSVSQPADAILEGDSVDVEFTVTADAADVEYTVAVTGAAGQSLSAVALGEGKYKVTASAAGLYTVTVTATGSYYGTAQQTFNVLLSGRISVDGEYASSAPMNQGITLLSAVVMRGETPTADVVTVKVYTQNGTEWVDASANIVSGVYTPTAVGAIKVEYTFGTSSPLHMKLPFTTLQSSSTPLRQTPLLR